MSKPELKNIMLHSLYDILIHKKQMNMTNFGSASSGFVPADTTNNVASSFPFCLHVNMPEVNRFIDDLACDSRIKLAGIAILKDDKLVAERYIKPYKKEYRHVTFSMCKSVVSMAVGIAIEEGLFQLSDSICELFPEYIGLFTKKNMKAITVRHLLTMTAGVKFDEISSCFADDWCKAFISSELGFTPGTQFAYNSLNSYMLAALITKKTGGSLMEYLTPRLFEPLGITDITWDTCPRGIERGGWGMKLSLQDMLKLGKLYLNDGAVVINGVRKQLVPKRWILESTKPHVLFRDKIVTKGYGYHIWCLNDGAILFNGVFGQNVYINRKKNLVIACTAGGYELFPEGNLVTKICKFASDDTHFKPHCLQTIYETLLSKIKQKNHDFHACKEDKKIRFGLLGALLPYTNQVYYIHEYASSVLPVANQLFYATYMKGIEQLEVQIRGNNLYISLVEDGIMYTFRVGYTKTTPFEYQIVSILGREMPVAAGCEIKPYSCGCEVIFKIYYLEEIANKIFRIRFEGDAMSMQAVDSPNMSQFLKKLYGETMMQRTKKLGRMKNSSFVHSKLKKVLFPSCIGTTRDKV